MPADWAQTPRIDSRKSVIQFTKWTGILQAIVLIPAACSHSDGIPLNTVSYQRYFIPITVMRCFQILRHPGLVADLDGLVRVAVLVGHGAVDLGRIVHTRCAAGVQGVANRTYDFISIPDFRSRTGKGPDVVNTVAAEACDVSAEGSASAAVFAEGIA